MQEMISSHKKKRVKEWSSSVDPTQAYPPISCGWCCVMEQWYIHHLRLLWLAHGTWGSYKNVLASQSLPKTDQWFPSEIWHNNWSRYFVFYGSFHSCSRGSISFCSSQYNRLMKSHPHGAEYITTSSTAQFLLPPIIFPNTSCLSKILQWPLQIWSWWDQPSY